MRSLFIGLLIAIAGNILLVEEAKACHAMALINFQIDSSSDPNGIIVSAESNPATFGCTGYWMDIEVRCLNEDFEGALFNPGFWGPLASHPYFQSPSILIKNSSSDDQNYSPTFVPYSALCPGVDYKIRARENHNGNVGPWTAPLFFTAPGIQDPLIGQASASPIDVCPDSCAVLTANVTGGCNLNPEYLWFHSGETTQQVTVCPNDTTTYQVQIVDPCTQDTIIEEVTVNTLPPLDPGVASISDVVVCEGEIVDLSVVGYDGDLQWQSSTNNGVTWNDIVGETNDTYTSEPITVSTCYRVEVSGCGPPSYTDEVCVTMSPYPEANFDWDPACVSYDVNFNNQSSANGDTFEWDFGDGNSSTDENPTHIYSNVGNYDVELIVVNADGCGDTITQNVTIYPNPVASFDSDSVCFQQFNDFTNTSTVTPFDNDEIDTWDWSFGDGNVSSQESPEHGYVDEGVYDVTLVVTTNNGCSDTITQTAIVWPLPDPALTINDNCVTLDGDFTDNSTISNDHTTNEIVEWFWQFGDGATSEDQNPSHAYNNTGDYEVTLFVTSNNGCTNSISDSLTIIDFADADFDYTPTGGHIPLEVDFTNNSTGGTSYEWDFDNGETDFSTTPDDLTVFYYDPGSYLITLTVGNGICETIDSAILVVDNYPDLEFNIPNVITPNGDNVNDVLHFDLRNVARVEVRIYNRWGNLVGLISSSEDELGWDATDRATGLPVTDGVYFYTYEFHALNGEVETGQNYIHVKRDNN
jgi:gliding motility-associated-like protein